MKILNENQRSTIFILYIFTELYEMKKLLKCSNLKLGLEALILGVEKNCSLRIKKQQQKQIKKGRQTNINLKELKAMFFWHLIAIHNLHASTKY